MPKNPVTDPITNQEIAFVHLILAGTMNDRRAAKAAGLNPDSAAYTKAKPRVQAYMLEHRAAVEEKLVDHEVEGLRKLNLSRDQILTRLWELAKLSPEVTRGSITGQVKAMSMIVALEGLLPNPHLARSLALSQTQPATVQPQRGQQQTEGTQPCDAATAVAAQPVATPAASDPETRPTNNPPLPHFESRPSPFNPFINSEKPNPVSATTDLIFDTVLNATGPFSLSLPPKRTPSDAAVRSPSVRPQPPPNNSWVAAACAAFYKESRMKGDEFTKLHRRSAGIGHPPSHFSRRDTPFLQPRSFS